MVVEVFFLFRWQVRQGTAFFTGKGHDLMGHRLHSRNSSILKRHAVAWAASQALWLTAAGLPLLAASGSAIAQADGALAVRAYAIPAGSLENVLTRFA